MRPAEREFVGRVAHGVHGRYHRPGGKADARTAHKLDVDPFVFRNFQDLSIV